MITAHSARLVPRDRLRAHGHADGHLCLVLGGSFDERVSRRREACAPGTLRISRPETQHDLTAGPDGAACLLVELPGELLAGAALAPSPSAFVRVPSVTAPLRSALTGTHLEDWELELAVLEVLARAGRHRRHGRAIAPPPWLGRVRDRLAEDADPPRLSELAAECGVNPCHLARAFRDHYGVTAGRWFRQRRLARAAARLASSADSVAAIAADARFADQAHLTREFRRHFGVPPGAWRRAGCKSRSRHAIAPDATLEVHPEVVR